MIPDACQQWHPQLCGGLVYFAPLSVANVMRTWLPSY